VRALRSPVTQFLVAGLITVAALVLATGYLADRAANSEAVAEAQNSIGVIASTVAPKGFKDRLLVGRAGDIDRFTRRIDPLIENSDVEHIVIWSQHGRVVYSDETDLIGGRPGLGTDQLRVVRRGGTGADWSGSNNKAATEIIRAPTGGELLQTYTRVTTLNKKRPLLFEGYFSVKDIENRRQEIFSAFRWLVVGPLLVLIVIVTAMLRVLTGQLTRAGRDRERLLLQAIDASDSERRRIARDLHDGVVQDLAGTAFSVSAVARDPATPPETRASLEGAARSLRDGLKDLRSLLAEIHPPELRAEGLRAALADLTAPAGASGIQASVSVEGAETASDERVALVWRVAQEAVRNALRHSAASTLAVSVRGMGGRLALEVVDDGIGFAPAEVRDPERFGLRGLRSLVSEAGGTLHVRSSPREGTSVRMEVDAR
jgi:two-component system, NarL family, sensor kinase